MSRYHRHNLKNNIENKPLTLPIKPAIYVVSKENNCTQKINTDTNEKKEDLTKKTIPVVNAIKKTIPVVNAIKKTTPVVNAIKKTTPVVNSDNTSINNKNNNSIPVVNISSSNSNNVEKLNIDTSISASASISTSASLSKNNQENVETSIISVGDNNTIGDFCDNIFLHGPNIKVATKCNNIHVCGEYVDVDKHSKNVNIVGYGHHVKTHGNNVNMFGSYGYSVNSGEMIFSTDFEVNGVKKIGKSQNVKILMTCKVNARGVSYLMNSKVDKMLSEYIYFVDKNTIAYITIKYVIINKSGLFTTGIATNTVKINNTGCSEWNSIQFTNSINSNSLPGTIKFLGINLNKYNNSTSIQVQNELENDEIEVLADIEMICLQRDIW